MLSGRSASKTDMVVPFLIIGLVLGLTILVWFPVQADDVRGGAAPGPAPEQTGPFALYLPALYRNYPWVSPFGVEPTVSLKQPAWREKAVDLRAHWIRLNGRISWRLLQPEEGVAIDWAQLAGFEQELQALKAAGMTPIVIVDDHPEWATIEEYGADHVRSTCAAIRADKYEAFAQFMRALVAHFKDPQFNVHHWELGNEPDVDPALVAGDSSFGCWGDIDDPYYGGERYGDMLKVVTPAIRAEDPRAVVLLGGLLLDRPETTAPGAGHPELFLEGILRAGGGAYFDVLAFHTYPSYSGTKYDHDLYGSAWTDLGGFTLGKATFLRQVMVAYGLDKPLLLDETGLKCNPVWVVCDPGVDPLFFEVQASHVTRAFVRGLSDGIVGSVWYTLDGPGWQYTNLVEATGTLKPVYVAYQVLTEQLDQARYLQPVDYGPGLEAYAFRRGTELVHVIWAIEDEILNVVVPASGYVAAFDRDGYPVTPTLVGADYEFQVGFEPIYIILSDDDG
jgi:hypothetical protein